MTGTEMRYTISSKTDISRADDAFFAAETNGPKGTEPVVLFNVVHF